MSTPPDPENRLTDEEMAYLRGEEPIPKAEPARIERRRPGWLVAGLMWATFGFYLFFWVGLHWAEMKRELKDDRMYPVWHSLAMAVPIYCYFRLHANYRVLNELLRNTSSPVRVKPMQAIGTFLLASLLLAVPIDDLVLQSLNMAAVVGALSWVIYHGQTGMNAYWDARPSVQTTSEVKRWEKIVVFIGGFFWWLILTGIVLEIFS
jgi:hypothetical protein